MGDANNTEYVNNTCSLDLKDVIDLQMMKGSRTIVLNSDVDEYLSGKLTRMFDFVANSSDEPITLLISSHGGEIDAGGAIIRAIENAREGGCSIIGEVRGYAMSTGAMILEHCDQRLAAPEDIIMVHGVTTVTMGDIRNQAADLALTNKMMEQQAAFLAQRNTSVEEKYRSKDFWLEMLKDNTPHYFFGREALEAGLIDQLIGETSDN